MPANYKRKNGKAIIEIKKTYYKDLLYLDYYKDLLQIYYKENKTFNNLQYVVRTVEI